MTRLILVSLAIALFPGQARSDIKTTELVRVTGTLVLPKGETLPQGAKVSVKIYLYKPDGRITWYQSVGEHAFTHADPNKPVTFTVPMAKSHLQKYQPEQFLMKATISSPERRGSKTIFATDDPDAVMPFDSKGNPKTNVKLPVSKTADR
jgi:hypothetical protein